MMNGKIKKLTWLVTGVVLGFGLSLHYTASAQHSADDPTDLPLKDLRTFSEVFGKIKSDYVDEVPDHKLVKEAIIGMVSGLDPHSAYLDEDAYKELQTGTQGEFGGLGLEVTMEDGFVEVVSPIDDSPASEAHMKSGDMIIKIDETAVKGLSLGDAVKKMRGKVGSSVTLTVLRKSETKPLVIKLVRAIIKVKSVTMKEIEPGYASFRISQFQERTAFDLAKAFDKFNTDNHQHLKGMILDLRNNPGGLLNSAVGVSAVLLPKDTLVVYTEGRIPDSKMRLTTIPDDYLTENTTDDPIAQLPGFSKKIPVVVLVNGGSASASEIVAGALQDQHRATIMGTRTFGKGSVQTVISLGNDTALKLTTARYFTPNGRSIQAKGIEPDVVLKNQGALDATLGIREADLEGHLANPKAGSTPDQENHGVPESQAGPEEGTVSAKVKGKPTKSEDVEMQDALTYLKQHPLGVKP